jgi:type II restriction enzyme
MSEDWVSRYLFCPSCNSINLSVFPNNNPIGDFYCSNCTEEFELKCTKRTFGSKVVDGAYSKMISRISSNQNPNFLFLSYDSDYLVNNLFLIPKHFLIPEIIEKRNPLNDSARRAGWIGCNILLSELPKIGRISIIKNATLIDQNIVNLQWQKAFEIRKQKNSAKGWLFEILKKIEKLNRDVFFLDDVYGFELELKKIYPENRNIKPKIRQQLQKLRDLGYIEFLGSGKYLYKH